MKTLKILPWLARRAGITEAHADELWAEAIRRATEETGWVGTPEYWKSAMGHLLELIEDNRTIPREEELKRARPSQARRWSAPKTSKSNDHDSCAGKLLAPFKPQLETAVHHSLRGPLSFSR